MKQSVATIEGNTLTYDTDDVEHLNVKTGFEDRADTNQQLNLSIVFKPGTGARWE